MNQCSCLTHPCATLAPVMQTDRTEEARGRLERYSMPRILVIDDEPRICELLHTVLQRKGHEVVLAENGSTGVERFRQDRPAVRILDLNLPDLNGLAVLTQIRAIDPQAPVMILTGVGTKAEEQQARALGVTDFLEKGFSLHALGGAMNQVLSYV